MKKFEFIETIKATGHDKFEKGIIRDFSNYFTSKYEIANVVLYYGGTDYAVVKGKIPLEVAKIIYTKYPKNQYGIRVAGDCIDTNPEEHVIVDEYFQGLAKKINGGNENLDDYKYIDTYHIDTKEGLVIFLSELDDYYCRKQGLPENSVSRYNEIITSINIGLIDKIKPNITAKDWMKEDKKYGVIYDSALEMEKDNPFRMMFRKAVDSFDKAVNPFINEEIVLDDISKYSLKVTIDGNVYEQNGRNECCKMTINNVNDTDNERVAIYSRDDDGFYFTLNYKWEEDKFLSVSHYFTGDEISEKGINLGEWITVFYKIGKEKVIDLRLNLINGNFQIGYEKPSPATYEQIARVYNELVNATELASNITIKNMAKKQKTRKLKR